MAATDLKEYSTSFCDTQRLESQIYSMPAAIVSNDACYLDGLIL